MFTSSAGEESIEVKIEDETVWLTQTLMAKLFDKSVSAINEHIRNIYAEQELSEVQAMKKFGNSEFATKQTNVRIGL